MEYGHPLKCVRRCVPGNNGVACPDKLFCGGTGTTEKGENHNWCMAAPEAPPSVECTSLEIMVYEGDRNQAFCGKPCKADSECLGGKHCVTARKQWRDTMGMQAALANSINVCK